MKTNETGLFAVLAVVMAFAIGCGGGVSSDVSVSYKPSSLESSDDGSDDGADDGSDDGGGNEGVTGILRGRIVFDGNPITFIYLAKAPKNAVLPEISSEPVPFDNKNCRFEPHAVFVRNGQPLNITNSDVIAHNTHTYPLRNRGISEVIKYGAETDKDRGLTVMYNKPEKLPFRVKCDFHTWMEGYQLTLNHPFAAVTKKDGSFEIKDLPTGKHTFIIWQERAGYLERKYSVTIKEGDNNDQKDISFGSAKFARFDGPEPKTILISSTKSLETTTSGGE
jgi:plastocyanin